MVDMEPNQQPIDSCKKGYLLLNHEVSLFDFGNVLVQKNYKENHNVRIICGGTHNYYDYIGPGMLTAAIQGNIHSSYITPSPNVILKTIQELGRNHEKGVFIIIETAYPNNISFNVAVERALNEDINVKLLPVLLHDHILIMKIAGALANMEYSLVDIYDYCKTVLRYLITTSHFHVGHMLNKDHNYTVVHIVKKLLNGIVSTEQLSLNAECNVVLFVNHLNVLNKEDELAFVDELVSCIKSSNHWNISRIYIGNYLNISNGPDILVTVLKVFDDNILTYLDAPCNAPGWKRVFHTEELFSKPNIIPIISMNTLESLPSIQGPCFTKQSASAFKLCLQFACDALISCENMLNGMDLENGSRDTGSILKFAATIVKKEMSEEIYNTLCPFVYFSEMSRISSADSHAIVLMYSSLFEAAAKKFAEYSDKDEVTLKIWVEALESGCSTIKKYCYFDCVSRTILERMFEELECCAIAMRENLNKELDDNDDFDLIVFGTGVTEAEKLLQRIKRPGCAYPDAGAQAIVVCLRSVYEGLKLKL